MSIEQGYFSECFRTFLNKSRLAPDGVNYFQQTIMCHYLLEIIKEANLNISKYSSQQGHCDVKFCDVDVTLSDIAAKSQWRVHEIDIVVFKPLCDLWHCNNIMKSQCDNFFKVGHFWQFSIGSGCQISWEPTRPVLFDIFFQQAEFGSFIGLGDHIVLEPNTPLFYWLVVLNIKFVSEYVIESGFQV